jgi:hypothetical protein
MASIKWTKSTQTAVWLDRRRPVTINKTAQNCRGRAIIATNAARPVASYPSLETRGGHMKVSPAPRR